MAYDNASANPPGGLYSFGTDNTDRALGLVGSGNNSPKRIGVVLKNTSGSRITGFTVSYTGEQWYDGAAVTSTEQLQFKYKKGTSLGSTDIISPTGFTGVSALDFNSPQNSASGHLDGNAPANSQAISATFSLTPDLAPNEEIMLIWEKDNADGSAQDSGLAVDDLSIKAGFGTAAPVVNCPATVTAYRSATTNVPISAFDPNGTVTSASIGSVTPGASGFSIINETPATSPGGIYTGTLQIDGTQATDTYTVSVDFMSAELNETTACQISVDIMEAPGDLEVTKNGPATYRPDEQLSYVITVNPGAAAADNVVLTDTLPVSVTYVSDDSGLTPTQNGQDVVWDLGTLSASKTINVVATANADASGTLTNTVTVNTSSPDSNQANNTDMVVSTLRAVAPDFSGSSKKVSATTVQVGEVFTYTLSIANGGDADGTYVLTDTLDPNLTLMSAEGMQQNGQSLTATAPISAGTQISYTISVKAKAPGTVNNAATLTGDGQTRTLSARSVTVVNQATPADFSNSTKSVNTNKVSPGGQLVYTITVVNSGQQQGSYVLTDTLDPNLTLVSTPPGMTKNGQTLTASGALGAGMSQKYVVTVTVGSNVSAGTIIDNKATLTGDGKTHVLTVSPVTVTQNKYILYLPMIVR